MNTEVRFEALKRTAGHHWLHDPVTQKQSLPLAGYPAKDQEEEDLLLAASKVITRALSQSSKIAVYLYYQNWRSF